MPREKIFHEFKEGTLHSGSKTGPRVTNRKQAIAIAMKYAPEKKARGGFVGNDEPPAPPVSPVKRGGRQPVGRFAQAQPKGKGGFKVNMQAYSRGGLVK